MSSPFSKNQITILVVNKHYQFSILLKTINEFCQSNASGFQYGMFL